MDERDSARMTVADAGRSLVEVAESAIYYRRPNQTEDDGWWCNACHRRMDMGHFDDCPLEALDVACQTFRSVEDAAGRTTGATLMEVLGRDDDRRALESAPESVRSAIRGALAEEREWVRAEIALALGSVPFVWRRSE